MSIIIPKFNADAGEPIQWTRSTSVPVGGKDGDRHTKITDTPYNVGSGMIYRNFGGTWRVIGRETDWWAHAVQNGWSFIDGSNMAYPPPATDTGVYDLSAGTLTKTATQLDFAGSTSGASWKQKGQIGGSATMFGKFTVSTLPATAGVASLNIGCGPYYGPGYPFFAIDATTKAVTRDGTYATGITALAGDTFFISSQPGASIMAIERAGDTIWDKIIPGYYDVAWGNDYGKAWTVFAIGTLTAGIVNLGERGVVAT